MGHRFDVSPDCSVELSPLGYQFFTDIFEVFDKVSLVRHTVLCGANRVLPGQGWCPEQR